MPTETAWTRVDRNLRKLLPGGTSLLLGLLAIMPLPLPQWGALAPPLMLAAVYYWSLSRPTLLPPSAAFALGLFQDFVTGAPAGSGALVMVLVQWVLRSQQRFLANRPFLLLWLGFAPVLIAVGLINWAVYALYSFAVPPIGAELIRAALGFVLFPVVTGLVLIPAHRALTPG